MHLIRLSPCAHWNSAVNADLMRDPMAMAGMFWILDVGKWRWDWLVPENVRSLLSLPLLGKERGWESRKPFRSQFPLWAPTPIQRLQVCPLAALSDRLHGAQSGAAGAPVAHHPTPMLYQFRMEHSGVWQPHCPHLPAWASLPGSQLRALIIHDKCAEGLAGSSPGRRGSYLAGQGREQRGWALALRTESASWGRGHRSPGG